MCGISGVLFKTGTGAVGEMITKMSAAQQHRGPDSTGYALYGDRRAESAYVVWANLPGRAAPEDERSDVLDAVVSTGGTAAAADIVAHDQLRMDVELPGDPRRLVDAVERAGAEVTSLGRCMELVKDVGCADDVADAYKLRTFHGTHGLGHVRMATESAIDVTHAHPFWAYPFPDVSVVHNGQITNYWKYRRRLELEGQRFRSHNDSELIAVYVAVQMSKGFSLEESLRRSQAELDGVYTFLVATENEIGVAKDHLAAKPLVVMEDDRVVGLASEEVALRAIFPAEIDSWDPYDGNVLVWSKREG